MLATENGAVSAAHTPGPWKHVRIGHWTIREAVWSADHGTVCTIPNAQPIVMREANARLIAAAPALLEALEKLVAECGSLQIAAVREGLGNTNAAVLNLRAQEARAAIAQARCREISEC